MYKVTLYQNGNTENAFYFTLLEALEDAKERAEKENAGTCGSYTIRADGKESYCIYDAKGFYVASATIEKINIGRWE